MICFKKYAVSVLAFLLITCSFGQKTKFQFDDGFCSYTGYYDSRKYTEEQLRNTLKYLYNSEYVATPTTVWRIEEMKGLNTNELSKECDKRLKELNENKFVQTDFWKTAKLNRIREIEETCRLKAFTIAAYSNPDTLMFYDKIDSLNGFYRDALIAGGDKMLDAWKVLNEVIKSRNGYPDRVQREFDEQFNSPQQLEYARLEIMSFGWWNNSNHMLYRSEETINYFEEFKKLFSSLGTACEDEEGF